MDTEDSKILSQAPNCPMEKEQKDEGYFDKTQTLKDAGMIEFSVPCHRPSSSEQRKEEEPHELLVPDLCSLPLTPPTAVDCNFTCYFAPDFMKPDHDQYVYRHPNGLCVIGLASTHVALKDNRVKTVDFNVGKSNRSEIKVSGKRKRNAQRFEPNTALCKVSTSNGDTSYIVRCCVKGSLLEVNERLIKQADLLNSSADREGYIAIIMPTPTDWIKAKNQLLSLEEFKKLRGLC